ncbi:MAG TPA: hypothetical protein VK489_07425 [Ferruginibacter sp.]|nr:hypothetical protein [Ferruginibacter sp.]
MEKIKFGVEVMVLLLALPVWFIVEVKQADKVIEKNRTHNIDVIDVKKPVHDDGQKQVAADLKFATMHFSKLMFTNN